jgi:hypothetical protein
MNLALCAITSCPDLSLKERRFTGKDNGIIKKEKFRH